MIYPTAPAWSLKSRNKTHQQLPTPSPDAYNPDLRFTLSKSPTWKLGKQLRKQASAKKIPAPNRYQPPPAEKSTKFGIFGQEKRLKQIISFTPGPGAYQASQNKQNTAAKFTNQPKCTININEYPGPGAYDACLKMQKAGIKMTRQARFATENNRQVSPGPADYQCARSNSGSHSFGRAQRISEPKVNSNHIGPGQYHFKTLFEDNLQEKKGFSIAARHNTKAERCGPGPGNYSPTYRTLPTSPSITISKKYRQRPQHRSPSPAEYDPQCLQTISKAGSFSIGKAEKLPLKVDNYIPGPGAYLKTQYISTGVSISLGKSRKHQQGEDFPGPAAYNPRPSIIQERPKSAKLGLSKRFEKLNTECTTSPAFYDTKMGCFDNPRYSFPKKKRLNSKKDFLPGPGAYNIPSTIGSLPCQPR